MGKVTAPQLSWRMLLLGAAISAISALGSGGIVYLSLGLDAAKEAWSIAFLITSILNVAIVFSKLMQGRSARYYYLGGAFFTLHLALFFYFFLIPVFFVIPIWFSWGAIVVVVLFLSILMNVIIARRHIISEWGSMDLDVTVLVRGVRGVSISQLSNTPDMSDAPNMFNFKPRWLSMGVGIVALGGMIFGFNLRKAFPDFSMLAVGCGSVYIAGYFVQWLVLAFYKIRVIDKLEKKYGHPLVAADFAG